MLSNFRTYWHGLPTFADLDVSIAHRRLDVRVARAGKDVTEIGPDYATRTAPARTALDQWVPDL